MVFSSSLFLFYFLPLFLLIYYLTDQRYKNTVLLVASIFFYAWGAPTFIFIVLASIILDFYLVQWMHNSTGKRRKQIVTLSVIHNIALLGYFKYANFFVENLNTILQGLGAGELAWTSVALPIGISFFTFQKMTYPIDVYRNVHAPLKNVGDFAMYILMFPQLIAGPIVRYVEVADQITDRRANETVDNRLTGFFRFTIGLAKKVLIANVLGEYVDKIFAMAPADLSTPLAWIGVVAYAFQIYYDFSGYSDMAIGLGRMIGFEFPENFNNPYISQSISEFWRRWHMTLGRFMKGYLYIPLGGNRVSTQRMYFNLWLVFLISGLWHGAAWNFVVWGAFHGTFLVLDRLFLLKVYKKIGKIPSIVITFLITLIGWVLFRADSLTAAWSYLQQMFAFNFTPPALTFDPRFWAMLVLGAVFAFYGGVRAIEAWQVRIFAREQKDRVILAMAAIGLVLLVISASSITSQGFNPFIYFRF
ncbi:MAG: MBOAT family protein [Lentimicrobiaceae bacterium]|nr:MBOAT family protein [Lentimicrobiaceae bacterium]